MPQSVPIKLQHLYSRMEDCKRCRIEKNHLRHIFGGGQFKNPRYFFLFINPTHKNRSSHATYAGVRRYPFIGVRHLYKGLAEAGFLDMKLIHDIYERGWQIEDEHRIEESLRAHGVYISNFVKCAQPNPANPSPQIMKEDLPLLLEELRLVNPTYVVPFGLLPLKALTGVSIRLRDMLESVEKNKYEPIRTETSDGKKYDVLPCYYPLGHGNPPKANKILRYIKANFI